MLKGLERVVIKPAVFDAFEKDLLLPSETICSLLGMSLHIHYLLLAQLIDMCLLRAVSYLLSQLQVLL